MICMLHWWKFLENIFFNVFWKLFFWKLVIHIFFAYSTNIGFCFLFFSFGSPILFFPRLAQNLQLSFTSTHYHVLLSFRPIIVQLLMKVKPNCKQEGKASKRQQFVQNSLSTFNTTLDFCLESDLFEWIAIQLL